MFSASAPNGGIGDRTFVRRALILFLLVVIALVLWSALHALVLLFGSILFAVILRGPAGLVSRWTRLPDTPALGVVVLVLAVILVGFGWLFGNQISTRFSQIADRIPGSLSQIEERLRSTGWGQEVLERTGGLAPREAQAGTAPPTPPP